MHRIVIYAIFGVAALAAAWSVQEYAPQQHNPLKPLAITDPVGAATAYKLRHLDDEPQRCFAVLNQAGVFYERIDDTSPRKRCGFYNALELDQSFAPYSAPLKMSCPMAAALAVWEKQVALPLAEELLGSPVARIETFGSFSCRRVKGVVSGRWSEHATGNAVDISGFKLADGRVISVQKHWGNGKEEGAFLRKLHEEACRVFSVTLGPDYNTAHHDHFHFDMGDGDVCA